MRAIQRVVRVLVMQGGAIIPYAFSDQPLCDVRQENILTNMSLIPVTMLISSDQGIQLLLRTVVSLRPAPCQFHIGLSERHCPEFRESKHSVARQDQATGNRAVACGIC